MNEVVAQGVTKLFGRHRALAGVSTTFAAGQVAALLGGNGAGKSTLLGVLSTLVRPTSGQVNYGGLAGGDLRRQIGMLAHESMVYGELSAIENLRFFGRLYELDDLEPRIVRALDRVGLAAEARLRNARTFSRGMLQRLAVARALLHEPKLLLLDEPFTGLDGVGTRALVETIAAARARGCVVVVVTHDVTPLAGVVDQVLVLARGKVVLDERRAGGFGQAELKEAYLAHAAG